jgi:membrane protease YdiL (CAAX protease family)
VGAAISTTLVVTALSYGMPVEHAASAVGLAFLGATYLLALRSGDPDAARRHGLSLGGLLDPEPLDWWRLVRSALGELAWVLGLCAIVFPLFWVGYVVWWSPDRSFVLPPLRGLPDEALGQLLVIAIPEEAFYRGYVQTRLDEAWPLRRRVLGAPLGPGVVVTSALFALGHLATDPNPGRLAVFFPSLLFGWLRARRGGIGASAAFHAACNLFASLLARGYGFSH